jgi:hypothetical protein
VNFQTYESSLSDQPAWFPYDRTDIYNPALLPAEIQEMIKGGGNNVFEETNTTDTGLSDIYKAQMDFLGLDYTSRTDCQIFADLKSVFDPDNGVSSSRGFTRSTSYDIQINNNSFKTDIIDTPAGVGYAMIARQLAAAQLLAKRNNTTIGIKTLAVNSEGYNGFSVWPKLGYEFKVPESIRTLLRNMGFNDNDTYSTLDLMTAQNTSGQLGFDVWRDVVDAQPDRNISGSGITEVYPDGILSPAMRITREYGLLRGFVKSERQPTDLFSGNPLSEEDDTALRQAWLSMGKKRNQ